jgi:spore germination protein KB
MAGTAGWLALLLAFVVSLLWVWMATKLSQWAPAGNWAEAVFSWLGPWAGRAFLLYLIVVSIWFGGLLLAQDSLVFHVSALPATPLMALTLATLVLVVVTDFYGTEVFIRVCQVLLWIALPLIFGFFLGAVNSAKWERLLPWLGEGPTRIAHASYLSLPWAMEGIIFILFFGSMVGRKKHYTRYVTISMAMAGVTLAAVAAVTLAGLGRGLTETYVYPVIPLALSTGLGKYLQGLETFVYPLWLLTSYVKVTAFFVLASESLRGVCAGIRQPWRGLAIGLLFGLVSLIPNTLLDVVAYLGRVDNTLIMPLYGVIPVMLVWAWWKRRRLKDA